MGHRYFGTRRPTSARRWRGGAVMTLRLLSSGVDSLYLSVNGGVRSALLAELETAQVRAQREGEAVPFAFAEREWRLLLKPGGHGGYAYWLGSPDVELWVGRHPKMK